MVILLMTEIDELFSGFYGAFKISGYKLTPIRNLLAWKTTESMVYYVVQSYEWLVSSETKSWYSQEDVDKLFM